MEINKGIKQGFFFFYILFIWLMLFFLIQSDIPEQGRVQDIAQALSSGILGMLGLNSQPFQSVAKILTTEQPLHI